MQFGETEVTVLDKPKLLGDSSNLISFNEQIGYAYDILALESKRKRKLLTEEECLILTDEKNKFVAAYPEVLRDRISN